MDQWVVDLITVVVSSGIVGVVVNRITSWMKNKEIISAQEETKVANDITCAVEHVLDEVKAFYNKESPMSATSIETIKEEIATNSYQMTEESANRIYETCSSEEEKMRIADTIYDYEHPKQTGEECCVYTIETTGAVFEVQWGVPELIHDKSKDYKCLTQEQMNDICELFEPKDEFFVLFKIIEMERSLVSDYTIEIANVKVHISEGTYTVIV